MKNRFSPALIFIIVMLIFFSQTQSAGAFDVRIREHIQESRTNSLDYFMDSVTNMGDGTFTGSIALSIPDRELQRHAIKTQIVAAVSTNFLKFLIGRRRPSGEKADPVIFKPFRFNSRYHSMPSGHTAAAFALAASIGENCDNYRMLSYSIAIMVGISRIYRDDHWASDVIVGAGLGYLSAKFVSYHW